MHVYILKRNRLEDEGIIIEETQRISKVVIDRRHLGCTEADPASRTASRPRLLALLVRDGSLATTQARDHARAGRRLIEVCLGDDHRRRAAGSRRHMDEPGRLLACGQLGRRLKLPGSNRSLHATRSKFSDIQNSSSRDSLRIRGVRCEDVRYFLARDRALHR